MKRARDGNGKFVKRRHADDVRRIERLMKQNEDLGRALKAALDQRDEANHAVVSITASRGAIVAQLGAEQDSHRQRIKELIFDNGQLNAAREHFDMQARMRACERVFLAGLIKAVWGLKFWMAITFHWADWVTLRKTFNGEWGPKGDGVQASAAEHEDFPGAP